MVAKLGFMEVGEASADQMGMKPGARGNITILMYLEFISLPAKSRDTNDIYCGA